MFSALRQPESYRKKKDLYEYGKTLGVGSFGTVREATVKATGERVAVKIILKRSLAGNEQMVLDEIDMLRQLHHPHIVRFVDWFESKDKFYIITQLATGGELFDRIIERVSFNERDAAAVVLQILLAVDYLHSNDIVHRDLKPENVLYLDKRDNAPVVIADFGISRKLNGEGHVLTSCAGSFGHAAPEVYTGEGHGKPCDIWSLGVITYTLLSGCAPFRSETVHSFVEEVRYNDGVVFYDRYWKDISMDAKKFILRMLDVVQSRRATTKELLRDPWITQNTAPLGPDAVASGINLMPTIREGFDGRSKLRKAVQVVMMKNRLQKLRDQMEDTEDEDFQYYSSSSDVDSVSTGLSGLDLGDSKRSSLRVSLFQQIVHTATENKEELELKLRELE